MTKPIPTDVVIQGGGPVGGTLALLLANQGIAVSVVDHLPLKTLKTLQGDHRGFALSQKSKKILEAAGIWSFLEKDAEPILKVSVSNGIRPFALDFEYVHTEDPTIGYLIDAYLLRQTVFKACYHHENIKWYAEASVVKMDNRAVTLSTGCVLRILLAVGADGKNSLIRSLSHISVKQHNYNQSALVFTLSTPLPHGNVACERFLPTGPFAILPMTQNRKAIVWTMPSQAAQVLLDMRENDFLEYLALPLEVDSKDITLLTKLYSYPLVAQHAETYVKPGVVLVGDAAHVIHPLAGQGLNLGFRDIECLDRVVTEARGLGLDIGSLTVLERYSQQRRKDTLIMKHAMSGLNNLFSNDSLVLDKLRDVGLRTFNKMPMLKRKILATGGGG